MNKNEFKKVQIGDVLVITQHGKNKGKMGIVAEIPNDGYIAYLKPVDCEFEFFSENSHILHRRNNKNGLYGFNYRSLNYSKLITEPINKTFYVAEMFGGEGASWSTENFTSDELTVIERFLKEFNENASCINVEEIIILDDED